MFSGIGGFALAAYNSGLRFNAHYFSEIDEYAVKVYKKRFPDAIALGDIREIEYEKLPKGNWLVTGGFPCQPHSLCGDRKGGADERNLWFACAEAISKIRPKIALFENVPGLLSSNGGYFFNKVLSDISARGYDAEWQIISANDVGAPHLRKRIWIVAYPNGGGLHEIEVQEKITKSALAETDVNESVYNEFISNAFCSKDGLLSNGYIVGENDGLSEELDRFKCLGNAIVPQCAERIMRLPAFGLWREAD